MKDINYIFSLKQNNFFHAMITIRSINNILLNFIVLLKCYVCASLCINVHISGRFNFILELCVQGHPALAVFIQDSNHLLLCLNCILLSAYFYLKNFFFSILKLLSRPIKNQIRSVVSHLYRHSQGPKHILQLLPLK